MPVLRIGGEYEIWAGDQPTELGQQQLMLFLAANTSTDASTALDTPMLRRLLARARGGHVVMNVREEDRLGVVSRIRALAPGDRILSYVFGEAALEDKDATATSYDDVVAVDAQTLLVRKVDGVPKITGSAPRRRAWGDVTRSEWRALRVAQAVDAVATYGTDGVFFDNMHGEIDPYTPYAGVLDLALHCATATAVVYTSDGSSGTMTLVADGAGAGSLTKVGTAYTYHYQAGVTTHADLEAGLAADAVLGICYASPTPAATLVAGDAIAAVEIQGQVAKSVAWAAGMTAQLDAAAAALPGLDVGYNGWWDHVYADMVSVQAGPLRRPGVTVGTVEFYGYAALSADAISNPGATTDVFIYDIDAQAATLDRSKVLQVHGTTPDLYYTYAQNLRNCRYTYAAYLCGVRQAHDSTRFFFSQDYQVSRLPRSRAGGLSMYSYFDVRLGEPVAAKVANGTGGFSREYEGGTVYFAPEGGGLQTWVTDRNTWTTQGTAVPSGTTIALAEDGRILLDAAPDAPAATFPAVISDSTTEWILEHVTGEWRYNTCTIRARTSTIVGNKIEIRAEVDDDPKPYGVAEVYPTGATPSLGTKDIPYGQTTTQNATHKLAPVTLTPDGEYHDVVVDLAAAFGTLERYRIPSVKVTGAIDVESIVLSDPELVEAELDAAAPVANFTSIVTLKHVDFTDTSAPNGGAIVSWLWNFGDGTTSAAQNPSHDYTSTGQYVVSLTTVDSEAKTNEIHKTIETLDPVKPVFVGAGAGTGNTVGITPQFPSGYAAEEGDIAILVCQSRNEAVTITDSPTPFAEVASSPQGTGAGAGACRLTVFLAHVDPANVVAPTIADAGNHVYGQILVFRHCRYLTDDPVDFTAGATAASSTAVSVPGGTTVTDWCAVLAIVGHSIDSASAQFSGAANGDLTDLAELVDEGTAQGGGGGVAVIMGIKAAAGAYGATTGTLASASAQGLITLALAPGV